MTPPPDPVAIAARILAGCDPARPLLLAVSGGSDSLALAHAFARARALSGGPVIMAATIDHGLRPASAGEAQDVARRMAALGVDHVIARWEGPAPVTGLQAAARLARHRLLAKIAASVNASCVLVGHTRDDQAETIAMRAGRSTDPRAPGLAGMAPATLFDSRVWFCRPFLGLGRQALRDFLANLGQDWIEDPSNDNEAFERVRLRRAGRAGPEPDWAGRLELGDAAARLLADHLSVPLPLVFRISRDGLASSELAARHALSTLAALAGGAAHRPGAALAGRIAAHCATGTGLISASRAIIEVRRHDIFLYREARNLPALPVTADPGEAWDNRFVAGTGPLPDRSAGELPADALPADELPDGVFKRARAGLAPVPGSGAGLVPVLSLWRHFLPLFDLPLAAIIRQKTRLDPLPAPPAPFFTKS